MTFILNEAVVKIRSEGIDKLDSDLKGVDKRLKRLGAGTAAKSLNADFRNTTRSANKLGESVGKVGNLLAVMPTRGTAAMSGYTGRARYRHNRYGRFIACHYRRDGGNRCVSRCGVRGLSPP